MQSTQKIYPGKFPRPSVDLETFEAEKILVAATPWGAREGARYATQLVKEYYATSLTDPEATSPFARMPGLSPTANSLRIATLIANDALFRKYNADQYQSACEILILSLNGRELSWIQVGQPHLLLLRKGRLEALQVTHDLGFDFACQTPLAGRLLGVDRHLDIEARSLLTQPGDMLVMMSRTHVPGQVFSLDFKGQDATTSCDKIFEVVAQGAPDVPFWVGVTAL